MFWGICIAALIAAVLIGMVWGDFAFDSVVSGAVLCGVATLGIILATFVLVSELGPKEGASSTDYIVEDVGGDMYYVDDGGSHKISSMYTPHFGDVKQSTYRITTYSWENWPHFPDEELLVPRDGNAS